MKLYVTRFSHFSRKVRTLLDLYQLPYELLDIGNVAEGPPQKFAGNPLCRVPVLIDQDEVIFDSDVIAAYIVDKHDPQDRYRVHARSIQERNLRTVLNGIMAEEVTVLIAGRQGVPTNSYTFFDDALDSIRTGLEWLEARADQFRANEPGYNEFHLVCAWEHIEFFKLVSLCYPKLKAIVDRVSQEPVLNPSRPSLVKAHLQPTSEDAVSKFMKNDRLGRLIRARFVSLDAGECRYAYEADPGHLNPNGILHGGALFTVMDSSQGMLIQSLSDVDTATATGTATIRYLKPVRDGRIEIRTWLDRREGRKLFLRSEAIDADGALVATMEEVWIASLGARQ